MLMVLDMITPKSLNDYTSHKFRLNETVLNKNEKIENEFILGFRKLKVLI